jgi:hypothetical protein
MLSKQLGPPLFIMFVEPNKPKKLDNPDFRHSWKM